MLLPAKLIVVTATVSWEWYHLSQWEDEYLNLALPLTQTEEQTEVWRHQGSLWSFWDISEWKSTRRRSVLS